MALYRCFCAGEVFVKDEKNVKCRQCGKQARQYLDRVPTKGSRPLVLLVLAVAVLFFWCFAVWFLMQPGTDGGTIGTTIMAGVIFTTGAVVVAASMVLPKQAHVVRCSRCGAVYVIDEAPSNTRGWNIEKYRKAHPDK